jgi:hypothetical protein
MPKLIPVTDPVDKDRTKTIFVNADAILYVQQEPSRTRIYFQNGGVMDVKESATELAQAVNAT